MESNAYQSDQTQPILETKLGPLELAGAKPQPDTDSSQGYQNDRHSDQSALVVRAQREVSHDWARWQMTRNLARTTSVGIRQIYYESGLAMTGFVLRAGGKEDACQRHKRKLS